MQLRRREAETKSRTMSTKSKNKKKKKEKKEKNRGRTIDADLVDARKKEIEKQRTRMCACEDDCVGGSAQNERFEFNVHSQLIGFGSFYWTTGLQK